MVVSTQVRLANDIAAQFRHLPPDQAAAAVARHLLQFWDPRMRAQLSAAVSGAAEGVDAEGIDPLVVAALARLPR